jgi:putative ABC transport system permease protein
MLPDLRFAVRSLLKSPGYTTVALITLALGIGVNTSMFSVIDALLFRSAPFPDSDRLVQVMTATRNGEVRDFSETELREIRAASTAFSALTTLAGTFFALSEPGQPAQRIGGVGVSADFFSTFGIQPMLGRAFTAEEYLPGRNLSSCSATVSGNNTMAAYPKSSVARFGSMARV